MLPHDGSHFAPFAGEDCRVGHHRFQFGEPGEGLFELFADFHRMSSKKNAAWLPGGFMQRSIGFGFAIGAGLW